MIKYPLSSFQIMICTALIWPLLFKNCSLMHLDVLPFFFNTKQFPYFLLLGNFPIFCWYYQTCQFCNTECCCYDAGPWFYYSCHFTPASAGLASRALFDWWKLWDWADFDFITLIIIQLLNSKPFFVNYWKLWYLWLGRLWFHH